MKKNPGPDDKGIQIWNIIHANVKQLPIFSGLTILPDRNWIIGVYICWLVNHNLSSAFLLSMKEKFSINECRVWFSYWNEDILTGCSTVHLQNTPGISRRRSTSMDDSFASIAGFFVAKIQTINIYCLMENRSKKFEGVSRIFEAWNESPERGSG